MRLSLPWLHDRVVLTRIGGLQLSSKGRRWFEISFDHVIKHFFSIKVVVLALHKNLYRNLDVMAHYNVFIHNGQSRDILQIQKERR